MTREEWLTIIQKAITDIDGLEWEKGMNGLTTTIRLNRNEAVSLYELVENNETKGMIKREDAMREARPEYLNPDQIGHEEYNKGWNDAVKAYWDGLKELKGGEDE